MENIWKSHELISFSWHLKLCALPAEWKPQRNPPVIPWHCAMWGGSLILLCGEWWRLQLPSILAPDLQLQLESFSILDLISAAVVTVLTVWSGREEALPWGTAAQVPHASSKTTLGCRSVISLLYLGGSCLIWVTYAFVLVRNLV